MAASIRLLEPRLANQIAAGEVVDRPASVVKELLENAIDAGATRIEVDIERGGTRLIRVTDNGSGIARDELVLALTRHATSKITTTEDLAAIQTLGFRGEALASISAVSKLLLISRPRTQTQAWQATAEGAEMQVQIQPAAAAEGTRVEVRDLFFNTPARRKFLRAERTEFNHIDDVVRKSALANPHVAFLLKHNGKISRRLPAVTEDNYPQRVHSICGKAFMDASHYFQCEHELMQVRGWVTSRHYHRSESDLQFMFINHRPVKDKMLAHAVRQAYEDSLPPGRFPGFVLLIEMDPEKVDVNVHPTKHEVRFSEQRLIHDLLARAVAECLSAAPSPKVAEPPKVVKNAVTTASPYPANEQTCPENGPLTGESFEKGVSGLSQSNCETAGQNGGTGAEGAKNVEVDGSDRQWQRKNVKRETAFRGNVSADTLKAIIAPPADYVEHSSPASLAQGNMPDAPEKKSFETAEIKTTPKPHFQIAEATHHLAVTSQSSPPYQCAHLSKDYFLVSAASHHWLLSKSLFCRYLAHQLMLGLLVIKPKYLLFPSQCDLSPEQLESAEIFERLEACGFRLILQNHKTKSDGTKNQLSENRISGLHSRANKTMLLQALPEVFSDWDIETIQLLLNRLLSGDTNDLQQMLFEQINRQQLEHMIVNFPDLMSADANYLLETENLDFSVFFNEPAIVNAPGDSQSEVSPVTENQAVSKDLKQTQFSEPENG